MPRLTPIQHSFVMGEISPLMYGRSDVDGYREGASSMVNMFPDSRGPAVSRKGSKFVRSFEAETGRTVSLPINEDFYYTATFTDKKLIITSTSGHTPLRVLNLNPHFNEQGDDWESDTLGAGSVVFTTSRCTLTIDDSPSELALVSQLVEGLTTNTEYQVLWALAGSNTGKIRVGSAMGLGDIFEEDTIDSTSPTNTFNTGTNTSVWISAVLDSDIIQEAQALTLTYLALATLADAGAGDLEFNTVYDAADLDELQAVQAPLGDAVYVLSGKHPPYKIEYDKAEDAMSWVRVTFTGQPPEWKPGNYPITGTFFQGRLWLGGPPDNNTTFWGSKSGVPEDFTLGAEADEAVQFTLNRFGAIRWMAGFKTLMMGTIYAEHIITSEGAFIAPQDIDVEQQSSYGSAAIQPVQVGDQIFYVSADRRKLRAIQYEWQADNWLSKDLTFNSEHITEVGIRRIIWHQNPKNLLHCILLDGTIASMTFERSSDTYGWAKGIVMQGLVQDATVAPINGTDYFHGLVYHGENRLYLETQAQVGYEHEMDSNVESIVVEGDGVITGLDHLEGMQVQISVGGALYPDQVVDGGQVPVAPGASGVAVVGLGFLRRMATLPVTLQTGEGSNAQYDKRWGSIVVRVLGSGKPKINGRRPATRHPSTPMNTAEPLRSEDIEVVELGHDRFAIITIEQDLPLSLSIVSLFGKLATGIT